MTGQGPFGVTGLEKRHKRLAHSRVPSHTRAVSDTSWDPEEARSEMAPVLTPEERAKRDVPASGSRTLVMVIVLISLVIFIEIVGNSLGLWGL